MLPCFSMILYCCYWENVVDGAYSNSGYKFHVHLITSYILSLITKRSILSIQALSRLASNARSYYPTLYCPLLFMPSWIPKHLHDNKASVPHHMLCMLPQPYMVVPTWHWITKTYIHNFTYWMEASLQWHFLPQHDRWYYHQWYHYHYGYCCSVGLGQTAQTTTTIFNTVTLNIITLCVICTN